MLWILWQSLNTNGREYTANWQGVCKAFLFLFAGQYLSSDIGAPVFGYTRTVQCVQPHLHCDYDAVLVGASVAQWTAGQQAERSILACTRPRGMIRNKIHLISPGCPLPSIALQCRITCRTSTHLTLKGEDNRSIVVARWTADSTSLIRHSFISFPSPKRRLKQVTMKWISWTQTIDWACSVSSNLIVSHILYICSLNFFRFSLFIWLISKHS